MKIFRKFALSVIIILLSASSSFSVCAVSGGIPHSYSVNDDFEQVIIPNAYSSKYVIQGVFDGIKLNAPQDLFISSDDYIYIADTGNNRIVKTTSSGELVKVYLNNDKGSFNEPKGVFVTKDNKIYIADSGNQRLVCLDQSGAFIKEFKKPKSDLISETTIYEPTKIIVCDNGLIYVLMGKEFMSITQDNEFLGYLGSEEVPFSIKNLFVNLFASDKQKKLLTKVQPSSYNNFDLSKDGLVYSVANNRTSQIKKITSVGENIYENKFYGEYVFNKDNTMVTPIYSDICVSDSGIIYVCESNSKKIYQYDDKGNCLSVFGGDGKNKGHFVMPIALDIDNNGNVYVLDSGNSSIQVFEASAFMRKVLEATFLFENGEYNDSKTVLKEIIDMNSGYALAHNMLGDIDMKQKQYGSAMNHYKIANNQDDYGKAYGKYRTKIITKYFGVFAVTIIALFFLIAILLSKLKRLIDKWNRQLFYGDGGEK